MQNNRRSTASALAIAVLAITASNTALANSYYHPANTEAGFTIHPAHFRSGTTRAQVQAEAAAFFKNRGSQYFGEAPYPVLAASQPAGKTRQQVIDETQNESPEQRKARLELYQGG